MDRRYVGVQAIGKPIDIFDRIRLITQGQGMTRTIPAVKFEKKPDKLFFVFLAVEGADKLQLPDNVRTVLQYAGFKQPYFFPLEPAEIESMTGSAELETYSLKTIPYVSSWSNDVSDPFDLSGVLPNPENRGEAAFGERYDHLLYWLSTNGEGTWQTFAKVCNVLQLAVDVKETKSIFRRLRLLGYIESSEDGQKWSICPTALVQGAADPNICFLTGQQTPKLIMELGEQYSVKNLPQSGYQGPSCVKVHGRFSEEISINGFQLTCAGPAAVQLAHLLPDLEGWKNILPPIKIALFRYNIERWNGTQFRQCSTFRESGGRYIGKSGMYRLTRKEETNPYQLVLYFDELNQRWLRGDWYGLRFLADNTDRQDFKVGYDTGTNAILIRNGERWPLLYERALVLASGMLPTRSEDREWLIYSGVSGKLVQLLTEKLNVSIREV